MHFNISLTNNLENLYIRIHKDSDSKFCKALYDCNSLCQKPTQLNKMILNTSIIKNEYSIDLVHLLFY
jgi:hypothetical protein